MKRTRADLTSELFAARSALSEARRQLAQSATEREQALRDCLVRIVDPKPVPRGQTASAEQNWREAIAEGRKLVGEDGR